MIRLRMKQSEANMSLVGNNGASYPLYPANKKYNLSTLTGSFNLYDCHLAADRNQGSGLR